MTITIDRKRKQSIEVFPTIDNFITFLKINYNNINLKNEEIKLSILKIYKKILNDEGNIKYLRLTRWLPKQFGFKHGNKFTLPFWVERGFTELEYKEYTDNIFKERGIRLTNYAKNLSNSLYIYDENYSNIYKFNTTLFKLDKKPNCNLCNYNLILKKSSKDSIKFYLIKGCSNKNCESKLINRDIKWKAFLPEYKYDELKKKLKEVKRSFSKDFWIERGYSEEEAINKVSEIQSNNSKKFKGKRTGKSKDKLKEKGYTDEEIRIACLSQWNLEYWIRKGYSEEESKEKVYDIQSYAAKHVDYIKRLLPSNIEYWINKGLSKNESITKVSEHQKTFSKNICIEKFGYEKGIKVFNKRQEKWQKSLYKNGNIKGGYSKVSQELFFEILKRINGDFKFAKNGGEFCIRANKNYYYDFTDIKNKKIIEYNGDRYHANPKIYNENDSPHPYYLKNGLKSSDIWRNDEIKLNEASNLGFEVLVIWDSDFKINKEETIQKCIDFLTKKEI